MCRAFKTSLIKGSKAIIIGTDCVDVDLELVTQAFSELSHNDLVLGPACDGGYYLIGCKHVYPELFCDVAWSTDQVLEQTLLRADQLQLKVKLLPMLDDIDE